MHRPRPKRRTPGAMCSSILYRAAVRLRLRRAYRLTGSQFRKGIAYEVLAVTGVAEARIVHVAFIGELAVLTHDKEARRHACAVGASDVTVRIKKKRGNLRVYAGDTCACGLRREVGRFVRSCGIDRQPHHPVGGGIVLQFLYRTVLVSSCCEWTDGTGPFQDHDLSEIVAQTMCLAIRGRGRKRRGYRTDVHAAQAFGAGRLTCESNDQDGGQPAWPPSHQRQLPPVDLAGAFAGALAAGASLELVPAGAPIRCRCA